MNSLSAEKVATLPQRHVTAMLLDNDVSYRRLFSETMVEPGPCTNGRGLINLHIDLIMAASLSEGIELVGKCLPEVVLLDVHLNYSDPIQTIMKLQVVYDGPIVALTKQARPEQSAEYYKSGVHDVLDKSRMTPGILRSAVIHALMTKDSTLSKQKVLVKHLQENLFGV